MATLMGMLAPLFLAFVIVMSVAVVAVGARSLGRRTAIGVAVGLAAWLVYVGLIGFTGVVANTTTRPPGVAFLFVPVFLFLTLLVVRLRSPAVTRLATAVPLRVALGLQVFRVVVELFLHQLWLAGLVPRMLTFDGANVDIYIGASAPLIAWLAPRGRAGGRAAVAWNALGLLALANVVVRAVVTTPGPLNLVHAEVPDRLIGTFPYTFVPGFLVPLAVVLHLLALRNLGTRARPASRASATAIPP